MKRFKRYFLRARFLGGDTGATSIEYALIAVGASISIAAVIFVLGSKVWTLFNAVADIKF